MLGGDLAYASTGWAWSDQFDCGLQVAGRLDDRLQVILRGSEEQREFTAFFLDEGVLAGVLAVNRPRDMAVGRRLIERRISADPASLADEASPLNALLKPKRS
jgi:3-phenylpropionate/trans-cinnamate dioxygenase ferredoxin reductase subunit